ncbi:hypothetical protein KCU93_g6111, partial [Aureobasidium melanogenum]
MKRIEKLVAEIETLDVANENGARKDTLKHDAPWMFRKHDETMSTEWTWATPYLIAQRTIRQQADAHETAMSNTNTTNPASSNVITSEEQK